MKTIREIQDAILQLSSADRAAFRQWFLEWDDDDEWDRQIERDVAAGRLDWLLEEVKRDVREGRVTDL